MLAAVYWLWFSSVAAAGASHKCVSYTWFCHVRYQCMLVSAVTQTADVCGPPGLDFMVQLILWDSLGKKNSDHRFLNTVKHSLNPPVWNGRDSFWKQAPSAFVTSEWLTGNLSSASRSPETKGKDNCGFPILDKPGRGTLGKHEKARP